MKGAETLVYASTKKPQKAAEGDLNKKMGRKYKLTKKAFAVLTVLAMLTAAFCLTVSAQMEMPNANGRNHASIKDDARSMSGRMKSAIENGTPGRMDSNLGDTDGDGVIEDDGEGGNSLIPEGGAVGDAIDDVTGAIDDMMPGDKDTQRPSQTQNGTDSESGALDDGENSYPSRAVGAIIAIVIAVALIIAVIVLIPKMRNRD